MTTEKKFVVIAIISLLLTVIANVIGLNSLSGSIFRTLFQSLMMAGLLFVIISINFFALSFFIRRLVKMFRKR